MNVSVGLDQATIMWMLWNAPIWQLTTGAV